MNNDNHSRLLSELVDIVSLIDNHLHNQEAPAHNSWRGTQMKEANLSPKEKLYCDILNIQKNIDYKKIKLQ